MKQLIINTEFFLQCHGHCSGCFLTEIERNSNSIYYDIIKNSLFDIFNTHKNNKIEHLIIGFGRGNILNLEKFDLDKLLDLIYWCENNFSYNKITFEVSTSLIGKLDKQIENAFYLLNKSQNIFFNIVINSEITSLSFWNNISKFYEKTSNYRKNIFGWEEDWGDILVLNINPKKLPNLEFIENFVQDYKSPLNISIFPFDESELIENLDIENVINWSNLVWKKFSHKDLNIKNYLYNLKEVDINYSISDLLEYQNHTEKSYYFIDKLGNIINGSLSIMGEVDKIRLLEKYNLNLDILHAYKKMQKSNACSTCDYQKECLLSGAYLNYLANSNKIKNSNLCLSGYQKLFELSQI